MAIDLAQNGIFDSLHKAGDYTARVSSDIQKKTSQVFDIPAQISGQAAAGDKAEISPQAKKAAEDAGQNDKKNASNEGLSDDQKQEVDDLSTRDRKVHAHEQAHLAAAGGLAKGGASYSYKIGPDGKRYAVGGEVSIDTSPVKDDPKATVRKAIKIRAAALAPADPSPQDRSVAAAADAMAAEAQQEIAQQAMASGAPSKSSTSSKVSQTYQAAGSLQSPPGASEVNLFA